ncbi:hypothetical protein E2C01_043470 [Portunus trituberculatus]|uniref:Uncharacterized protein n=1 Tax=Portunus trituberculatus TaxID=210409 RepID=A0A5B7FPK1_PORTR|nr:hypothetical protein [Portunus trituberculatus]
MFTFEKFPDTHRREPVKLILSVGHRLSMVGQTPDSGVVYGFICTEDFASSESKTTPPPILVESLLLDQAKTPFPQESDSLHSSAKLPASPPKEFDSSHSCPMDSNLSIASKREHKVYMPKPSFQTPTPFLHMLTPTLRRHSLQTPHIITPNIYALTPQTDQSN